MNKIYALINVVKDRVMFKKVHAWKIAIKNNISSYIMFLNNYIFVLMTVLLLIMNLYKMDIVSKDVQKNMPIQ